MPAISDPSGHSLQNHGSAVMYAMIIATPMSVTYLRYEKNLGKCILNDLIL